MRDNKDEPKKFLHTSKKKRPRIKYNILKRSKNTPQPA